MGVADGVFHALARLERLVDREPAIVSNIFEGGDHLADVDGGVVPSRSVRSHLARFVGLNVDLALAAWDNVGQRVPPWLESLLPST